MEKKDDSIKNALSDEAKARTTNVQSQGDLSVPEMKKGDMPEADRDNFNDGVYTGTGTGAGPGGSTDTGGADTTTMEDNARLGTTDRTTKPKDRQGR